LSKFTTVKVYLIRQVKVSQLHKKAINIPETLSGVTVLRERVSLGKQPPLSSLARSSERTAGDFFERTARAVRTATVFFRTHGNSRSNGKNCFQTHGKSRSKEKEIFERTAKAVRTPSHSFLTATERLSVRKQLHNWVFPLCPNPLFSMLSLIITDFHFCLRMRYIFWNKRIITHHKGTSGASFDFL